MNVTTMCTHTQTINLIQAYSTVFRAFRRSMLLSRKAFGHILAAISTGIPLDVCQFVFLECPKPHTHQNHEHQHHRHHHHRHQHATTIAALEAAPPQGQGFLQAAGPQGESLEGVYYMCPTPWSDLLTPLSARSLRRGDWDLGGRGRGAADDSTGGWSGDGKSAFWFN